MTRTKAETELSHAIQDALLHTGFMTERVQSGRPRSAAGSTKTGTQAVRGEAARHAG